MQARLGKLETDVGVLKTDVEVLKSDVRVLKNDVQELKIDVAVIKSNYATKTDIIDAKNRIIVWVVSAFFLAQLFPYLIKALAA